MADLNLGPTNDRSTVKAFLIAAVVLAAVAGAIFYFVPRDTAKLTVTNVQIFAPKTEFKPGKNTAGMNIVGQESTTEDDLYVIATVHLQNTFHMPISLGDMSGTLTLSSGSEQQGSSVTRSDVGRLKEIFPAIAPLITHPIGFDDEVAPGKALDGQVMLQFPGVDATGWQNRKSATLTLAMHNQPSQTVTLQ